MGVAKVVWGRDGKHVVSSGIERRPAGHGGEVLTPPVSRSHFITFHYALVEKPTFHHLALI